MGFDLSLSVRQQHSLAAPARLSALFKQIERKTFVQLRGPVDTGFQLMLGPVLHSTIFFFFIKSSCHTLGLGYVYTVKVGGIFMITQKGFMSYFNRTFSIAFASLKIRGPLFISHKKFNVS